MRVGVTYTHRGCVYAGSRYSSNRPSHTLGTWWVWFEGVEGHWKKWGVCVHMCLYFMVYIFYLVLVKGGNVFIITPLPLLSVITYIFSSASFSSQMVAAFCSLTINKWLLFLWFSFVVCQWLDLRLNLFKYDDHTVHMFPLGCSR